MGNGYKVSHPKLDCYYTVTLTVDQYNEVLNHLGEMGEGGKCERMSDLTSSTTFDSLVDEMTKCY